MLSPLSAPVSKSRVMLHFAVIRVVCLDVSAADRQGQQPVRTASALPRSALDASTSIRVVPNGLCAALMVFPVKNTHQPWFCPGVLARRLSHEPEKHNTDTGGCFFVPHNKTRAEGQEPWRKLLKHWHMLDLRWACNNAFLLSWIFFFFLTKPPGQLNQSSGTEI